MNKLPYGTNRIGKLFRKRKCFAHEPGTALAKGIVESLNMRRFAGFLADRLVTLGGKNAGINRVEIGETDRPLAILRW